MTADAKQLEWVAAVYLSKDEVGYKEIHKGFDQHSDNQARLGLPDRLTAKRFLFKLIFGGTDMGFANDPDFLFMEEDQEFWAEVIRKFYFKYPGVHRWHNSLLDEAALTGRIVIPTGRIYTFERLPNGKMPRTTILNYPVQGMGAEIMLLCRILTARTLKARPHLKPVKLCSTVHDSLDLDLPQELCDETVSVLQEAWADAPSLFYETYGVPFDLPLRVEIKVGKNLGDMEVIA